MNQEILDRKNSKEVNALRMLIENLESTTCKDMFLSYIDYFVFVGSLTEKQSAVAEKYLVGFGFNIFEFAFTKQTKTKLIASAMDSSPDVFEKLTPRQRLEAKQLASKIATDSKFGDVKVFVEEQLVHSSDDDFINDIKKGDKR